VDFIVQRAVQLIFTSNDLHSVGNMLGCSKPYVWNDNTRSRLRAELDAYYAHLYSVTREELRYILDPKDIFGDDFPSETFRVLKEHEENEDGEYRTRRLVLEAFDELAKTSRFAEEMTKRVFVLSGLKKQDQSIPS
jgi:hypothetical protein